MHIVLFSLSPPLPVSLLSSSHLSSLLLLTLSLPPSLPQVSALLLGSSHRAGATEYKDALRQRTGFLCHLDSPLHSLKMKLKGLWSSRPATPVLN